jgi:hypothetical protein
VVLGRTLNRNSPADLLRTGSPRIGFARWGIVRGFGRPACSRYSIGLGLGKRSASGPKGSGDSANTVFGAGVVRLWASVGNGLFVVHTVHRTSTGYPRPPRRKGVVLSSPRSALLRIDRFGVSELDARR